MTGLGQHFEARKIRDPCGRALRAAGVALASSLMSAPATKALAPAPVRITARMDDVRRDLLDDFPQLGDDGGVERVQLVRSIDGDDGDAVAMSKRRVWWT